MGNVLGVGDCAVGAIVSADQGGTARAGACNGGGAAHLAGRGGLLGGAVVAAHCAAKRAAPVVGADAVWVGEHSGTVSADHVGRAVH